MEATQKEIDAAILKFARKAVKGKGNGTINILLSGYFSVNDGSVQLHFIKINEHQLRADYDYHSRSYSSTLNITDIV